MAKTSIEWSEYVWNPVRGCVKVSPGCKHCYAETFAERFRGVPGHPFEQGFDLRIVPEKLEDPLRWRAPRRVFVNSMSDLFQAGVPTEYIAQVGRVMGRASLAHLPGAHEEPRAHARASRGRAALVGHPPPGLVRSERREPAPWPAPDCGPTGHARASRFLSIEPLLEDLGSLDLRGIHWVIVGGESGPRARPMQEEWVLSIRDQCRAARVPFFFKQWGGVRKHETGRVLRGRTYGQLPREARGTPLAL